MISHLHGRMHKLEPGAVDVDVNGVGYLVRLPITDWDQLMEGATETLWTKTYVREDRFDLYGFLEQGTRSLFEELIDKPGIGPKLGLELCSTPKSILLQAIGEQDPTMLMTVKGIGRKTAEKLLLELKSLLEKRPDMFGTETDEGGLVVGDIDKDVIAALRTLGYDTPAILRALRQLPKELRSTEERVSAALRAI